MNELILLPCLDSAERAARCRAVLDIPAERAARCRAVLDIPRARAAELGRTAVQAAATGVYTSAEGTLVHWQAAVAQAVAAKRSLPPDAVLPVAAVARSALTRVQVANETTLTAARRLADAAAGCVPTS